METVTPARRPTVWITNLAGHDYDKAEHFGDFKHVTRGYISFQSLDRIKFRAATILIDSKPDDYILLSGANIVAVMSVLVFYQMHGHVRLLNFDRVADTYRELLVTGENLNDLLRVLKGSVNNDQEANRV